jgi:hypothetical protein
MFMETSVAKVNDMLSYHQNAIKTMNMFLGCINILYILEVNLDKFDRFGTLQKKSKSG